LSDDGRVVVIVFRDPGSLEFRSFFMGFHDDFEKILYGISGGKCKVEYWSLIRLVESAKPLYDNDIRRLKDRLVFMANTVSKAISHFLSIIDSAKLSVGEHVGCLLDSLYYDNCILKFAFNIDYPSYLSGILSLGMRNLPPSFDIQGMFTAYGDKFSHIDWSYAFRWHGKHLDEFVDFLRFYSVYQD